MSCNDKTLFTPTVAAYIGFNPALTSWAGWTACLAPFPVGTVPAQSDPENFLIDPFLFDSYFDANGGLTVTYGATGLPPGLHMIDPSVAGITGVPSSVSLDTDYSVTLSITTENGTAYQDPFIWTITNTTVTVDSWATESGGVWNTESGFNWILE